MEDGQGARWEVRAGALARGLAWTVIAIAGIVLLGWASGWEAAKSVLPGVPPMKVNTAVGLALLAVAVLDLARGGLAWGRAAAAVAVTIGLLTVVEYVSGTALGIDELVVKDVVARHTPFPGRMSPLAAVNLAVAGLGLLAFGPSRWQRRAYAAAALAVGTGAILVLTAYLYRTFLFPAMTQMAVNTAVAFVLLSVAMVAARPRERPFWLVWSEGPGGAMVRRLAPVILVLPLVVGGILFGYAARTPLQQDPGLQATLVTFLTVMMFLAFLSLSAIRLQRTDAQRRRLERHFRSVSETANDAIITADASGRIQYANPASHRTFGWPDRGLLGQELTVLMPARFRDAHHQGMTRYLATGEGPILGRTIEGMGAHRDGHEFPIEITISAYKIDGRDHFSAVLRDITTRKRAEDNMRRHAKELEDARAQAEAASHARAAFLANMSHEIRTPLNAILGMVNIMAEDDDGAHLDRLQVIRNSGKHLLSVINDILDLTKIDAGQMELELSPTVVVRMVEEACDVVAAQAEQKGLELINDTQGPTAVLVDAGRVRQILVNLLSNAVKFTDAGEVRVTTRGTHEGLRFEVSDTGRGIAAGDQQVIWEAFRQGDMASTRREGGSGLGLAITQRLVEKMGGRIRLRSQHGKGSTFTVDIPCEAVAPPADADWLHNGRSLAGRLALLVDDNVVNLDVLERQLASWKMEVVRTTDPDEAASLAAVSPIDVAILDLHMPDKDGVAVAREIQEAKPDVPLILLASSPVDAPALFSGYLTKPPRVSDLYHLLLRVVRGRLEPAGGFDASLAQRVPLRVLVAEDNPYNQIVASSFLEKFGYRPDVAADGAEAIRMAQAKRYDLILMDIQMPVMDGLDAARAIRAFDPDVRIVGLSAHVGKEDRDACRAAGMVGYLPKPIDIQQLKKVLQDG